MYKYAACLLLYGCTINNYEVVIKDPLSRNNSIIEKRLEKVVKECNFKNIKFDPTPTLPIPELMKAEDNYSLKTKILLSYVTELKSYIKQMKTQTVNFKCD